MFLPGFRLVPSVTAYGIIDQVARHGHMTVADLVVGLGVTTTAVRQQVNRLVAEGWLVRTRRRRGPGRPADVFTTSEQARRLFGRWDDELSKLLIEEIAVVEGPIRSREILQAVGRRMAERGRRSVGDGSPVERLRRLAELLGQAGVLAETTGATDDPRLRVFTCPYRGLANEHREVCEMERETFSELVGGAVQRDQCVLDGHERCEFRVSSSPGANAGS